MTSAIQMLTVEERERLTEYADRWYKAQDIYVLSLEESSELESLLWRAVIGIELGELGFSDAQSGGLYADSGGPE